jgi:Tfp pilus assembly protein PilF
MYQQAMEYAPRFEVPHVNYAQLLLAAGREDEALQQFRIAARLNPYNYIALANLGVKAYKDQDLQTAVVFFDRAIRVHAEYAMGHKYLGLVRAQLDQPDASARHLERSLELDDRQPEAEKMRFLLEEMKKRVAATG